MAPESSDKQKKKRLEDLFSDSEQPTTTTEKAGPEQRHPNNPHSPPPSGSTGKVNTELTRTTKTTTDNSDDGGNFRKALTCPICYDLLSHPHLLIDCGHTFCFHCLHSWLSSTPTPILDHATPTSRTCPSCRKFITRPPMLNLVASSLTEAFLESSMAKGEDISRCNGLKLEYERKRNNHENPLFVWRDIFGPGVTEIDGRVLSTSATTRIAPTIDYADGVARCTQCSWELVRGRCVNCGKVYFAPDEMERAFRRGNTSRGAGASTSEDERLNIGIESEEDGGSDECEYPSRDFLDDEAEVSDDYEDEEDDDGYDYDPGLPRRYDAGIDLGSGSYEEDDEVYQGVQLIHDGTDNLGDGTESETSNDSFVVGDDQVDFDSDASNDDDEFHHHRKGIISSEDDESDDPEKFRARMRKVASQGRRSKSPPMISQSQRSNSSRRGRRIVESDEEQGNENDDVIRTALARNHSSNANATAQHVSSADPTNATSESESDASDSGSDIFDMKRQGSNNTTSSSSSSTVNTSSAIRPTAVSNVFTTPTKRFPDEAPSSVNTKRRKIDVVSETGSGSGSGSMGMQMDIKGKGAVDATVVESVNGDDKKKKKKKKKQKKKKKKKNKKSKTDTINA